MAESLKSQYDPTGTVHIRNEFSLDMASRFDMLQKELQTLYNINIFEPCPPSLTSGNFISRIEFTDTVEGVIAEHVEGFDLEFDDPLAHVKEKVRQEANRILQEEGVEIAEASSHADIIRKQLKLHSDEYLLANPELFICTPNTKRTEVFLTYLERRLQDYILDHFLTTREITEIFASGSMREENWSDEYIDSAFRDGVFSAAIGLQGAGMSLETNSLSGKLKDLINEPIRLGMLAPHAVDLLRSLRTGTRNEIVNLTTNFRTDVSQIVSRGLQQGLTNSQITGNIEYLISHKGKHTDIVDTLGRKYSTRDIATSLARTEVVRAYNQSLLDTYETFGITQVSGVAEFRLTTAGDKKVCPVCRSLEGTVYSIAEAKGILPVHRNCRCTFQPVFKRRL